MKINLKMVHKTFIFLEYFNVAIVLDLPFSSQRKCNTVQQVSS